jgi:hypothetical protein
MKLSVQPHGAALVELVRLAETPGEGRPGKRGGAPPRAARAVQRLIEAGGEVGPALLVRKPLPG